MELDIIGLGLVAKSCAIWFMAFMLIQIAMAAYRAYTKQE